MKEIESYINGNLNHPALKKIEKKINTNKAFMKKVLIHKNIDIYMKGALMAADAEIEMVMKKIDMVAAGFVIDYIKQSNNKETYREFLSWS